MKPSWLGSFWRRRRVIVGTYFILFLHRYVRDSFPLYSSHNAQRRRGNWKIKVKFRAARVDGQGPSDHYCRAPFFRISEKAQTPQVQVMHIFSIIQFFFCNSSNMSQLYFSLFLFNSNEKYSKLIVWVIQETFSTQFEHFTRTKKKCQKLSGVK